MNAYHSELLKAVKKHTRDDTDQSFFQRYTGSSRYYYGTRVPDKRVIAKKFLKNNQLSIQQFMALLTSLYSGDSYDERTLAGYWLENSSYRMQVPLTTLEQWLGQLEGWAEIDTTCQSNYTAAEVLSNWREWEQLLRRLNSSHNINERRASLVLLITPARQSADPKIADLSFELISHLESEKSILITKAISWLLRSLITHHPKAVTNFLVEHHATLPKIAIRETKSKLETGKKNHGKKK